MDPVYRVSLMCKCCLFLLWCVRVLNCKISQSPKPSPDKWFSSPLFPLNKLVNFGNIEKLYQKSQKKTQKDIRKKLTKEKKSPGDGWMVSKGYEIDAQFHISWLSKYSSSQERTAGRRKGRLESKFRRGDFGRMNSKGRDQPFDAWPVL